MLLIYVLNNTYLTVTVTVAVVTNGTGGAAETGINAAGKTGTADHIESKEPHAWFIGFAPYGGTKKIAFAVLIENGRYGGRTAAPAAAEMVGAAADLGLFGRGQMK